MTQNINTNFYPKEYYSEGLRVGKSRIEDLIVSLAWTPFSHNLDGKLRQPLAQFLEWIIDQMTTQGDSEFAKQISNQIFQITSEKELLKVVGEKGSVFSKQQMIYAIEHKSVNEVLFPSKVIVIVLDTLQKIGRVQDIPLLHSIVENGIRQMRDVYFCEVLNKNHQTEKGISIAHAFLLNQLGLKTVQLIFSKSYLPLRELMARFYLDDKHPMDLQKLLRDPQRSYQVGRVMRNLMKINAKAPFVIRRYVIQPLSDFNRFLATYVKAVVLSMDPEKRQTNLLAVPTVELDILELRKKQESYYASFGVSNAQINDELQFSTPFERKGIYLFPHGVIPKQLGDAQFLHTEQEVFLRIPDAENRVVVISKEGFKILEKLQLAMTQNLFQLIQTLNSLFPDHLVTGRVKSARSFLDKCGRLCEKAQIGETQKYRDVTNIVDGCGCRITCSSSSQIYKVIQTLKEARFEFLELDNKYNTIRKDGAYKVIPCTVRDLNTGLVFELQITTLTSTAVSDLFHNVIYKKNTIGLNPTEQEVKAILSMQRFGALTETVSFIAREPIILTKKLKSNKIHEIFDLLQNMIKIVIKTSQQSKPKM